MSEIVHVGYVRSFGEDPLHGQTCTVNLEGTDLLMPADAVNHPVLTDHSSGRIGIGDRVTLTREGSVWVARKFSE